MEHESRLPSGVPTDHLAVLSLNSAVEMLMPNLRWFFSLYFSTMYNMYPKISFCCGYASDQG